MHFGWFGPPTATSVPGAWRPFLSDKPKGSAQPDPVLAEKARPTLTFAGWNETKPGLFEADLFAQCGWTIEGAISIRWYSPTLLLLAGRDVETAPFLLILSLLPSIRVNREESFARLILKLLVPRIVVDIKAPLSGYLIKAESIGSAQLHRGHRPGKVRPLFLMAIPQSDDINLSEGHRKKWSSPI